MGTECANDCYQGSLAQCFHPGRWPAQICRREKNAAGVITHQCCCEGDDMGMECPDLIETRWISNKGTDLYWHRYRLKECERNVGRICRCAYTPSGAKKFPCSHPVQFWQYEECVMKQFNLQECKDYLGIDICRQMVFVYNLSDANAYIYWTSFIILDIFCLSFACAQLLKQPPSIT